MNIILKEVNRDNWYQCVKLKVAEHQKNFVAPNTYSLAQAAYEPGCIPLCIYSDDIMVGFVMFAIDKEEDGTGEEQFWICRFMIDENYQGKGYGKAAMTEILQYAKSYYDYSEIYLSEVPGNESAKGLYQSFGFQLTGEVIDGEEVMVLSYK